MRCVVDVRDVTKTYGNGETASYALRGVDFRVERGEVVMLSGPSVSGKTTLLSIVGCILKPTSGRVVLFDQDILAMPEHALPDVRLGLIGFVFQSHNLLVSHTAEENIVFVLRLRGWTRQAAAREARRTSSNLAVA